MTCRIQTTSPLNRSCVPISPTFWFTFTPPWVSVWGILLLLLFFLQLEQSVTTQWAYLCSSVVFGMENLQPCLFSPSVDRNKPKRHSSLTDLSPHHISALRRAVVFLNWIGWCLIIAIQLIACFTLLHDQKTWPVSFSIDGEVLSRHGGLTPFTELLPESVDTCSVCLFLPSAGSF